MYTIIKTNSERVLHTCETQRDLASAVRGSVQACKSEGSFAKQKVLTVSNKKLKRIAVANGYKNQSKKTLKYGFGHTYTNPLMKTFSLNSLKELKTNKVFYNFTFDKGRLKSLVSWSLKNYGEYKTINLLENLKKVGFEYATKAGISLGIEDLKIPPKKALLLYEAEEIAKKATDQYNRSEITGVERFQRLIDTWHRTSEQLKQEVIDHFENTDVLNPVYMMAFSGARGNISQVRQLVGMRGLMADPKGQIIDYAIRSNFREGLTLTEYIISCYGARKGIVDTALRTANAGYLTRRLVDVAQHVVISNYDCGTKKGIFLTDMKEGNKTIYSLQTRLLGRVLSRDIYKKNNTQKLASRNQEITADLAFELTKHAGPKIFVRSPLTCETKKLICQLCYGWSLAQGNLVSIGEAVGIVAAQSIGEPGTQLTMRTFHTGGVFSGDISDQIRAPYKGFVHYFEQIAGTLIRSPEGKMAFLTKVDGSMCVYNKDNDISTAKVYKIPAYTILYYKNGETVIEKQVIAQISTIARQQNMRDDSELTVKSQIQGQFFVKTLQIEEKFIGPKLKNPLNENNNNNSVLDTLDSDHLNFNNLDSDVIDSDNNNINPLLMTKIMTSWDWGYAWILSCKLYRIPIFGQVLSNELKLVPQFGDFVDRNSIMSKIKWFLPPHGGHYTFVDNLGSFKKSLANPLGGVLQAGKALSSMTNTDLINKSYNTTKKLYVKNPNYIFNNINIKKSLLNLDIDKIYYHKNGYFLENNDFLIFLPSNLKGLNSTHSNWKDFKQSLSHPNNTNKQLNTYNFYKPLTELSRFFGIQVFPKNAFLKSIGLLTSEQLFSSVYKGLVLNNQNGPHDNLELTTLTNGTNQLTRSGRMFLILQNKKQESRNLNPTTKRFDKSLVLNLLGFPSLEIPSNKLVQKLNNFKHYQNKDTITVISQNLSATIKPNALTNQKNVLVHIDNLYVDLTFKQTLTGFIMPQDNFDQELSDTSDFTKYKNYLVFFNKKAILNKCVLSQTNLRLKSFNHFFDNKSKPNTLDEWVLPAGTLPRTAEAKTQKNMQASKPQSGIYKLVNPSHFNLSLLSKKDFAVLTSNFFGKKTSLDSFSNANLIKVDQLGLQNVQQTFGKNVTNKKISNVKNSKTAKEVPYYLLDLWKNKCKPLRFKVQPNVSLFNNSSNDLRSSVAFEVNPTFLNTSELSNINSNKVGNWFKTLKTLKSKGLNPQGMLFKSYTNQLQRVFGQKNKLENLLQNKYLFVANSTTANAKSVTKSVKTKDTVSGISKLGNPSQIQTFNLKNLIEFNKIVKLLTKVNNFTNLELQASFKTNLASNVNTKAFTFLCSKHLGFSSFNQKLNTIASNRKIIKLFYKFYYSLTNTNLNNRLDNANKPFKNTLILWFKLNLHWFLPFKKGNSGNILNLNLSPKAFNKKAYNLFNATQLISKKLALKTLVNKKAGLLINIWKCLNQELNVNFNRNLYTTLLYKTFNNKFIGKKTLDQKFIKTGCFVFTYTTKKVKNNGVVNPPLFLNQQILTPCIFGKQIFNSATMPGFLTTQKNRGGQTSNAWDLQVCKPLFSPPNTPTLELNQNIIDSKILTKVKILYSQGIKEWVEYRINKKTSKDNNNTSKSLPKLKWYVNPNTQTAPRFLPSEFLKIQVDKTKMDSTNLTTNVKEKVLQTCTLPRTAEAKSFTASYFKLQEVKRLNYTHDFISKNTLQSSFLIKPQTKNSTLLPQSNSKNNLLLQGRKKHSFNKLGLLKVSLKPYCLKEKVLPILKGKNQNPKATLQAENLNVFNIKVNKKQKSFKEFKNVYLLYKSGLNQALNFEVFKNDGNNKLWLKSIFNKQLNSYAKSPLSKIPNAHLEIAPYAFDTKLLLNRPPYLNNKVNLQSYVITYNVPSGIFDYQFKKVDICVNHLAHTNILVYSLVKLENILNVKNKPTVSHLLQPFTILTKVLLYYSNLSLYINYSSNPSIKISKNNVINTFIKQNNGLDFDYTNTQKRDINNRTNLSTFTYKKALLALLNIVCFEFNLILKFRNYKYGLKTLASQQSNNPYQITEGKNFNRLKPIKTQSLSIYNENAINNYKSQGFIQTCSALRSSLSTINIPRNINISQRLKDGPNFNYFKTNYKVYFDNINYALNGLANTSFLSSYTGEIIKQPLNPNSLGLNPNLLNTGISKLGNPSQTSNKLLANANNFRDLSSNEGDFQAWKSQQNYPYVKKQIMLNNKQRCLLLTKKDLVSYKFSLSSQISNRSVSSLEETRILKYKLKDLTPLQTLQHWSKLKQSQKIKQVTQTIDQTKSVAITSTSQPLYLNKNFFNSNSSITKFKAVGDLIQKSIISFDTISPSKIGSFILRGDVAQKEFSYIPQDVNWLTGINKLERGLLASTLPRTAEAKTQNLDFQAWKSHNHSVLNPEISTSMNKSQKSLPKAYSISGQVVHINKEQITVRKAQPIFISAKSTFHAFHGDFVQNKEHVITLIYQKLKTGDIIQGIPKVEQFFESRTTKRGRLFRDNLPNLLKGLFIKYYVYSFKLLKQGFTDVNTASIKASSSESGLRKLKNFLKKKNNLNSDLNKYGPSNVANLDYTYLALRWAVKQSFYKIQQIAVDGVLRVYRSQGVTISDKHLEIIVKQMTTKVRVIQGGQTGFFPGELVDLDFVETINSCININHINNKDSSRKTPLAIYYEPVILGITKASLQVDSFLSSASFQQTARILSQSALFNKKDFLKGVKENVILGNLIPAGTGYLVSFFD